MILLIAEDNPGVRSLMRRVFLEPCGTVVECSDGKEAVEGYATNRPDVVLMDVHMPRMDGLAATRSIRQLDPAARVVIVTSYDDEDLRIAAANAGACAYSLKNDLTGLVRLIASIRPVEPQISPSRR
jgi:DNA-binding NarL/FixJ family response regulator